MKSLWSKFTKKPSDNGPVANEPTEAEDGSSDFVPAVLLNKTTDAGLPGCWLGGLPTLPSEIAWPWFEDKGEDLVPMHFMAQINLAHYPHDAGCPDLPKTGTLFVFQTIAIQSLLMNGKPECRIIHVDADVTGCPPRMMPDYPSLDVLPPFEDWAAVFSESRLTPFDQWNFDFLVFETHPDYTGPNSDKAMQIKEDLMKTSYERIRGATKLHEGEPILHHMFGANTTGYGPPLKSQVNLLAIGCDEDLGFFDPYRASWTQFCIDRADLEARDWDKVQVFGGGS